jgi:metallo-beta-lactamase class B
MNSKKKSREPEIKQFTTTSMPDLPKVQWDFTPMEPTRIVDNFYFIGTKHVGVFVIDTSDGLIMIDTGWGASDAPQFVNDMKKLGLNPGSIKLLLISHEHLDHYGGVRYLKREVCPKAKVGMSAIAWYNLQTRPSEPVGGPYSNPRPQSVDIFLTDGQKIKLGNTTVQIIFTPGHTPGCVSFIIPVTDNGQHHTVGIIGGGGLKNNWDTAYLFKATLEYFQKFTREAKCDIGLEVHPWGYEAELAAILHKKPGEPNPFLLGTDKFESVYLQKFKDAFWSATKKMPPEIFSSTPPWTKDYSIYDRSS